MTITLRKFGFGSAAAAAIAMAMPLLLASPASAQTNLSIATGGTGGVYYPFGGGIATMIRNSIEGYDATDGTASCRGSFPSCSN